MTRGALRPAIFLLLIVGVAAAGWQYYRLDLDGAASLREVALLDGFRDEVRGGITKARTAQQAYLAPGQGVEFWRTRFAEAIADVTDALENLRVTAVEGGEAGAPLDAADRALKVYDGLDRKIRTFIDNGSQLMAADVVYEDGVKTSALVVQGVEEAHRALATPHRDAAEANRRQQQLLAGGSVAAAVLVALLLLPRGKAVDATPQDVVGTPDAGDHLPSASWRLDDSADRQDTPSTPATPPPAPPAPAPIPIVATTAAAPGAALPPPSDDAVLAAAAQVCTDLAQVKDGDQLRDALGRAARVLDASGVIVWIADASGRALKPLLTYGYPEEALRRIPTLPRDADNATAAAWREGVTQVVEATDAAPGAVAVPILAPQGCTGVLAAEIGHHREASSYTRAVAQIVAAQLAVLIPPDTADADE